VYTPIIRNRQSEIIAIRKLSAETKRLCTPLVDLAAPSRSADVSNAREYTERNILRTAAALRDFSVVLIDSSELDPSLRVAGGRHPLLEAARAVSSEGITPIPVTGIHRDDDHMKAVKDIGSVTGNGAVCFRLDATDIGTARHTNERLQDLLTKRGMKSLDVILLLDLQCLYGEDVDLLASKVDRFIQCASESPWNAIIVAGYGIPDRISLAVPVRGQRYIRRVERDVYLRIAKNESVEKLWFGDYTSVAPTHVELDWKLIHRTMGPKAIYALKDSWFVIRGGPFSSDRDGRRQYHNLAAQIVALEEFPRDPMYSFGDLYIFERRIRGARPPGSQGSWISACVNHHITLTADIHSGRLAMNGE
jgi:hypothetical protein